jgi:hypothetical protein
MQGRDITKDRQMEKRVREFVGIFIHGTLNTRAQS